MFLLRTIRKRGVEVVGGDEVVAVDARLQSLYHALGTSLELQQWKFEEPVKRAIAAGDDGFARLCQAAEPLTTLVRSLRAVTSTLHRAWRRGRLPLPQVFDSIPPVRGGGWIFPCMASPAPDA